LPFAFVKVKRDLLSNRMKLTGYGSDSRATARLFYFILDETDGTGYIGRLSSV